MRGKQLRMFSSLLAVASLLSAASAFGQSNQNYAKRVLRGDVAPPLAAPNSSLPTASSTFQSDRDLRSSIMKDCGVSAWQVSIETETGGVQRVQMSPTLSPAAKKCITADAAAGAQ